MDSGPLFTFLYAAFRDVFFATAALWTAAYFALALITLIVDVFSPREIQTSTDGSF
jgi:hypothetical protein